MKRIIGAFVILAAAMLVAPASEANCNPAKLFGTWDFDDLAYYYVTGFSGDYAGAVGAFWQTGNRSAANEESYSVDNWLNYYAGYGWYLNGNLGDARVFGCPANQLIVVVTDDGAANDEANFIVGAANENAGKSNAYNYSDMAFVPIPRPRALNSTRLADNNVQLDLAIADPAAGYSSRDGIPATDVISAINIYTAKDNANPGTDAGNWTLDRRLDYAGGETTVPGFIADCTDAATDTWLAVGIEFGGEYESALVSLSTAVECDPGLADPDDKFQLIKGKGKGQKKGKPFRK